VGTKAVVYVRISEDREGAGLGVERQRKDCVELAGRLGWEVVATRTDNDTSAYTGKSRPGYAQLLDDLRSGAATGVLAWHVDRLHRSPVELEEYVSVCEQRGVVTQTVKAGELDLSTPSGRMIARQLGTIARYEVEHNIERLRAKRDEMASSGRWAGGRRPFGFEADGETIRNDEAATIREMTDAVIAGRSLRSLARELNERGVTTSMGGTWYATELRRMLLRPRNAGLLLHRGEVVGEAAWDAVVPEARWRSAHAILSDPGRTTTKGGGRVWLGTGLYRCGECGETLTCTTERRGRGVYGCLPTKHVTRIAEPLDAYVTEIVKERLRQPDAVELLTVADVDANDLQIERQGVRGRLDELARLFGAGDIDAAQLTEASTTLRARLAELDAQWASLASPLAGVVGRDPDEAWDELDLDRRRAVVDALVSVTVMPAPKGRPKGWKPGDSYFSSEYVDVQRKATTAG
jgi:site-specific DNA recombinase